MPAAHAAPSTVPLVLPVCFDADCAADLADVATAAGCTPAQVIERLTSAELRVERIGFLPGFPYIIGLPDSLHLPRRATPRPRVPAGSVALANGRLGVYPVESPGGWHLIGRTPLRLFDPWRDPPAYFASDARVAVHVITREEFDHLAAAERARAAEARHAREASLADVGHGVLHVQAAGPGTTVEDAGRVGWTHVGVAPGGASDADALRLANGLVGNAADAAVLEFVMQGPVLVPTRDVTIAVVGGECDATVDGRPISGQRAVRVPAGAHLRIGRVRRGLRAWLAVDGGITVPRVLGSRSTHRLGGFGGLDGRALRTGDELPLGAPVGWWASPRRFLSPSLLGVASNGGVRVLRYRPAASERHAPTETAPDTASRARRPSSEHAEDLPHAELATRTWRVHPDSDRMGLRLDGPPLPPVADAPDPARAPSVPVGFGTIQLPPDGRPIILGADHQTTGGYPILGTLIEADRSRFAQCRPGDTVRLVAVPAADADAADAVRRRDIAMACAALRL